MDSLDAIQREFLRGVEQAAQGQAQQIEAFNRLLALRVPLIPVAVAVHVVRVE
jgi:hypothetical protein